MKKTLISTVLTLWTMPALSAMVNVEVNSKNTGFKLEPYYVLYLANERGKFVKTLQLFGKNVGYEQTLKSWHRSANRAGEDIDALSGASLKKGAAFSGDFEIDDAYIAKGYKLILETSSASQGNKRQEVVITLDATKAKQRVAGKEHTDYVAVTLKDDVVLNSK